MDYVMSTGYIHDIHHISSHILRLGCCPCPIQWGSVGSTRLCQTPALRAALSCGSRPARPHLLASAFIFSLHVFLCLPRVLGPGSGKSVTDLIQDVACCTCPYHLSHPLRRTVVTPLMPSFWSSEADGVSSWSSVPQIHRIMVQPLQ